MCNLERGKTPGQIAGRVSHMGATPGVAGGKPRIVGHRITVQNVVLWNDRIGRSTGEIATEYGLSLAGVNTAHTYYYDHGDEITRRSGPTRSS